MLASILPNEDVTYLDNILLLPDGRLKLLSFEDYQQVNPVHLRLWAVHNARYCFPTVELIDWLRKEIGNRFAIELGAGCGDLGAHLGIIQTDSYMQRRPEIQLLYKAMGQAITYPPEDVYEYDALAAVKALRPDVAVAAWLTQKVVAEECTPDTQGSVYGADELEILKHVSTYIHIGNEASHGMKKALDIPCEKYYFPWLVSRAAFPEKNVIYIWRR